MSAATFLCNETLWQTLAGRIKGGRHVDAAIAYFGQDGAKLFPLRDGDRLIVDMSLPTVRAGGTDPHEIEKLVRRGVHAFSRRNLHAKLVVVDNSLICGSANISKHSQQVLDEAAILTGDPSAVRRARQFIDRLCTEPVRPEYLNQCKRAYKPPPFPIGHNQRFHQARARHAKLWMVNLRDYEVPDFEKKRYERGEEKARKLIRDEARSTTESFHWPYKPGMAKALEPGDWIIQALTYGDKSIVVYPPGQLLLVDHYIRDRKSGRERWVFHLEVPRRGQSMTWRHFRHVLGSTAGIAEQRSPRTKAIRDVQAADRILALWTPGGRISRR